MRISYCYTYIPGCDYQILNCVEYAIGSTNHNDMTMDSEDSYIQSYIQTYKVPEHSNPFNNNTLWKLWRRMCNSSKALVFGCTCKTNIFRPIAAELYLGIQCMIISVENLT
jgi:hypothetical protein